MNIELWIGGGGGILVVTATPLGGFHCSHCRCLVHFAWRHASAGEGTISLSLKTIYLYKCAFF